MFVAWQPSGPNNSSVYCATDRHCSGTPAEFNHALFGEMIFTRPAKGQGV
jgi:hypothetical protein